MASSGMQLFARTNGLTRTRPYVDSKDIVWVKLSPKGKLIYSIYSVEDYDAKGRKTFKYWLQREGRSAKAFTSLAIAQAMIDNWNLVIEDVTKSDEEIALWVAKKLMVRKIKPADLQYFHYVKWKNSIELRDDEGMSVYMQFYGGYIGEKDDGESLAEVGLTLAEFEQYLIKYGARKTPKPKRSLSYSYYD